MSSERSFMASRLSSSFLSRSSSLAFIASSSAVKVAAYIIWFRIATNASIILMLICMAVGLCKTDDSIATPCSVNAYGNERVPPQLEIPFWNFKFSSEFN